MYKSSKASRARGEPTTPKIRPLELSPDLAPALTRSDGWIQPAAEPRHRTKMPTKSALKKIGPQAPPFSRPCDDVDGDSGYGSGSSHDHQYGGFVVHPQPLGPPGVSGSPEQQTRPLGEQDSNRHNSRSPGVHRPQRYLPDTMAPVVSQQLQAPLPPPIPRHDETNHTGHESNYHKGKLGEKLPQNTSNAEPRYGLISSHSAQTPHINYGATFNPRHHAHHYGLPPTGYPIYGPPYPSQYPQQHYQPQYSYQGYPRRNNDTENYDNGLSDNEGRRRPLLPRPQKYMPDGYLSETGGMRQYHNPAYFGGRFAPPGRSENLFKEKEHQEQKERHRQQQLSLHDQQVRSVKSPADYTTQLNQSTSKEPACWVRLGDVLRMQGCDMQGHRLPTSTDRTLPSAPRSWTEPSLLRGVALSWPILEYRQRRRGPNVKPMLFFDISQDPDGTDGRGIRLLSHGDYGMDKDFPDEYKNLPFSTAIKLRYIDMKCTAPELQPWNVIIEHKEGDGIQVIDFFRAIFETYQKPLTSEELHKYRHLVNSEACQRAFKRRCRKAPGSTEYNELKGIRRVDLVGDRTLYLRLHCDPDTKRYEFDLIQQNQDRICASQLIPYRA